MRNLQSARPVRQNGILVASALVFACACTTSTALAQETSSNREEIQQLKKQLQELTTRLKVLEERQGTTNRPTAANPQLEELDQKVKILERNRELDQEAAENARKAAPLITIGDKGFSISSSDTNFVLQLKGVLQVDSRTFFEDSGTDGNDGFLLRRARPILQGTVFRDFDYQFVPDFGGGGSPQIFDAYINYRYKPALQFRAGKFKVPVGLEQLQSDKDTLFNERALPTALVPNRDLGFMLHGDVANGVVSYAAGIFNGVGDGRNSTNLDFDDSKSFAGRLFVHPFKTSSHATLQGLGLGVGSSYVYFERTNTAGLPNGSGYATPAQQQYFAYRSGVSAEGAHWRISPQGYYYYGPYSLLGEYVISNQEVSRAGFGNAELNHRAWQVAAGWVLTGEDATYTGVSPRRPFNPAQGGWGAVQLVGRYSEADLDQGAFEDFSNSDTSAHGAREFAVGVNWFLNRNLRFNTSFSHIEFLGGGGAGKTPPASVTRTDENVLFTRIQLAF